MTLSRAVKLGVIAAGFGLLGCGVLTDPGNDALRIHNAGTTPLTALVVVFPDAEASFGTIEAGQTSGYLTISGGVYRYAAFRFVHGGEAVTQLVDDWVGEVPMAGRRFTYELQLFTTSTGAPEISLVSVRRDD